MASRTSRVVLNRAAIEGVHLAAADGAFAVARAVIAEARPPDAPPYGKGLVEGGGAIAYAGKRKVDGTTIGGRQIKKPRAVKLDADTVQAIAGFGFPARFVNNGTVHERANPFLNRAMNAVAGRAVSIFRQAAAYRIARLRS